MTKETKMSLQDAINILNKRQTMEKIIKLSKQAEAGVVVLEECRKLVAYVQTMQPALNFLTEFQRLVNLQREVEDNVSGLHEKLEWLDAIAIEAGASKEEEQEQVHAEHSDETDRKSYN